MSTRATIMYGDNWHIYEELLDDTVHLEVTTIDGRILINVEITSVQDWNKQIYSTMFRKEK